MVADIPGDSDPAGRVPCGYRAALDKASESVIREDVKEKEYASDFMECQRDTRGDGKGLPGVRSGTAARHPVRAGNKNAGGAGGGAATGIPSVLVLR